MSDQILVHDAITGIQFHVEQTMTELVLKTTTANHEEADNRSSTASESLIVAIVWKVASSPQTTIRITEDVFYNPGFFAKTAAVVKTEQRNYTNMKAKLEEH